MGAESKPFIAPELRKSKVVSKTKIIFVAAVSCAIAITVFAAVVTPAIFLGKEFTRRPFVVSTGNFNEPPDIAWEHVSAFSGTSVSAIEKGINVCEVTPQKCDFQAGYGANPNEEGKVSLHALIADGKSRGHGAVGNLKGIRKAVSVAKLVMDNTYHSILVGEEAKQFATHYGLEIQPLETNLTKKEWELWKTTRTPNYWTTTGAENVGDFDQSTFAMIAIDGHGNIACGASSNGLKWSIEGRVADASILGASCYVDNLHGAAIAIGSAGVLMNNLPAFHAVSHMKTGSHPSTACSKAVKDIQNEQPDRKVAVICVTKEGDYASAKYGYSSFPFTTRAKD